MAGPAWTEGAAAEEEAEEGIGEGWRTRDAWFLWGTGGGVLGMGYWGWDTGDGVLEVVN